MSNSSGTLTAVSKNKKCGVISFSSATDFLRLFNGKINGNGVNCCYANSVLQMLLPLEVVYRALKDLDHSATNKVARELLVLFELKRNMSYTGRFHTPV